jgi:putative glycosyltransferase
MKLSIVTTLYQSASNIHEFYNRASAASQVLAGMDYEIIFVNDGSPDESLNLAVEISKRDPCIVVIDLSRNFGHHKSMMIGLRYAKGDQVFLIDSDLEEDPEWLLSFSKDFQDNDCDVVFGVQENRKGGWFERYSGQIFYKVFKLLTKLPLANNIVTSRLMTRRYVEALLLHEERELFMAGLWLITGFKQHPRVVNKHQRSMTTYTLGRKVSLFIDSITSFSSIPLMAIFYIGATLSFISFISIIPLVISWFFFEKPIAGWTSVIASIWLLGGMIISFIGVIGIYLSKIFSEVKQRPNAIVRQIYVKES